MADAQNHPIELLPGADRELASCEPIRLALAEVLYERGAFTLHVWFPIDSFVSLVAQVNLRPDLEVGMAGREGMLGAHLALGVGQSTAARAGARPRHGVAHHDWQLPRGARPQRSAAGRHGALYPRAVGAVGDVGGLRFHLLGSRLARWLLMSQDRANAKHFCMTQKFLAYMLGVRRVGITAAGGALPRRGLIAYRRGELTVLGRGGLEIMACARYAAVCKTYGQSL